KRMTWVIVASFIGLFAFLGLGFDVFIMGMSFPGIDARAFNGDDRGYFAEDSHGYKHYISRRRSKPPAYPYGTLIAVMGGILMTLNSCSNGPYMVLRSAMARRADPSSPEEKQFLNVLEEMATASGLPVPEAYVVPDPDLNAFATGFSPEKSAVAVTEGLIKSLNREELQGVVAHEMSHIRNYDIRLMTMVAALMGAIALLSDFTGRTMRNRALMRSSGTVSGRGGRRGKGGGGAAILFALWIIMILLAPLISRILAMAISRRREYPADASGSELTRNPLPLQTRLKR
ncbi:MAG: M48 family metalloprotease, partial [bacterium]